MTYVNVQVSEIEAYQQVRADNPFVYKKRNWFVKDLKVIGQFGENMKVGETAQFSALGHGHFLGREYVAFDLTHLTETLWVSHDVDIATVDENGFVIAKKPGTVDIEAMYDGKVETLTLTVHN